ncbi:MAG: AGE family epimerase/isomerase [Demequinaceae bacterium]|nr:AGE family epimerase/isomerase [Demequinaceae bacterium]
MNWLASPSHRRWLESETTRLLNFGMASVDPDGGFGWLLDDGTRDVSRDSELWITCRMTHVYSLAALLGHPGASSLVDHGLAALTGRFHDDDNGGWFSAVSKEGPTNDRKEAYGHAFVILAASSAMAAGRPLARSLFDEALQISEERFWDDEDGMVRESFSLDWDEAEEYRGVNANMHTVEAYLAASDVSGNLRWARRALRIVDRVVNRYARGNDWRIPEHFTSSWEPLLDYNLDAPAHPFRPFGATIGHAFEWARLTVQLDAALQQSGMASPEWMVEAARALYDTGVREGWQVDGAPGFVYTTDWKGRPVVRERMHWVAAEAIGAAAILWSRTKQEEYADHYRRWWDFVGTYHLDRRGGSWWHELGPKNKVSRTIWEGKADIYHAVQATLIPRLPIHPAIAASIAAGNLA